MSKLPLITARELENLLIELGFSRVRQKGSHVFYRHPDGRYTTIPHHGKRQIARPLLHRILTQIELTAEDYKTLSSK
jgi:predicted RNA binding protein YcfA (HicA-like mRNA interferase family)